MTMLFKDYIAKRIIRRAHEITELDVVLKEAEESTFSIGTIKFKAFQTIKAGDFVVYLKDDDIYHCNREVFLDRNEYPGE